MPQAADGDPLPIAALARQGRYRHVRDNLQVKEVHLDSGLHRR